MHAAPKRCGVRVGPAYVRVRPALTTGQLAVAMLLRSKRTRRRPARTPSSVAAVRASRRGCLLTALLVGHRRTPSGMSPSRGATGGRRCATLIAVGFDELGPEVGQRLENNETIRGHMPTHTSSRVVRMLRTGAPLAELLCLAGEP